MKTNRSKRERFEAYLVQSFHTVYPAKVGWAQLKRDYNVKTDRKHNDGYSYNVWGMIGTMVAVRNAMQGVVGGRHDPCARLYCGTLSLHTIPLLLPLLLLGGR